MQKAIPFLAAVLLWASAAWAQGPPALQKAEEAIPQLLEALHRDYRAYGLPLPPPDAQLRRSGTGLVLAIPPRRPAESIQYFVGTKTIPGDWEDTSVPVAPTVESLVGTEPDELRYEVALAVHCRERGWNTLALAILARTFQVSWNGGIEEFGNGVRIVLADMAWGHWQEFLGEPGSDRKRALAGLRAFVRTQPAAFRNPENVALVVDLERTLRPVATKPGSVAARIEALREMDRRGANGRWQGPWMVTAIPEPDRADPRYVALWRLGFTAVPELMRHLDDRRLTRNGLLIYGIPYFDTNELVRINDVVTHLLFGLSGGRVGEPKRRTEGRGLSLSAQEVRRWWLEARKQDEESYAVTHALERFPGKHFGDLRPARYRANEYLQVLIAAKYPSRLPDLYDTMIRRCPGARSEILVGLVVRSAAPFAVKAALLTHAAQSADAEHCLSALKALLGLKHPQTAPLLIARLDALPTIPPGKYWEGEARALAELVAEIDTTPVWDALERLARHSDIPQRLEMLENAPGTKGASLRFLARFLDDAGERLFPRLAVRDLAAMKMAQKLEIATQPEPHWTEAEWSTFRQQVRDAFQGSAHARIQ